ncbi:hypothetical protein SLS60_007204 [Paraconiothyrium brasiliense]|uniref:DUF904 domain-containing protein n=1 Tax=Paraconiothyrium brasiliense TaxID=300254 RepID=A0ABR3R8T0_9PLEO
MSTSNTTAEQLQAQLDAVVKQVETLRSDRHRYLKETVDASDMIRELREEADKNSDHMHQLQAQNRMLKNRNHELEEAQKTAIPSDHSTIGVNDNITATTSPPVALNARAQKP